MTYIIKRKLQSAVGGVGTTGDTGATGAAGIGGGISGLSSLIQHIQISTEGLVLSGSNQMDTLIVNHLVVQRTLKIPARTDGYK